MVTRTAARLRIEETVQQSALRVVKLTIATTSAARPGKPETPGNHFICRRI